MSLTVHASIYKNSIYIMTSLYSFRLSETVVHCLFFGFSASCINVLLTYLPPTKEEVNVIASVCLSVCLSVSKITQKHVHGFG